MVEATVMVLMFFSAALLAWGLLPDETQRAIRRRLFSEVAREKRPTWLAQAADWLGPLHRMLPLSWYSARVSKLVHAAGLRLHPLHFLVLQEIGALTGLLVYVVTLGNGRINVGWMALLVFIFFMIPYVWLSNRIKTRRFFIGRDLPPVVDLLNLCVGAGSDFIGAMNRIVREFRPCPLREELGVVLQEIRVGRRRRDALHAFADRLETQEARTFSRTLIQADRMGTGLSEALHVLSEDMRLARYHWAERFAQQAPLKMLLPLVLSLASALLIVAGPILIQFLRGGFMPYSEEGTPQQIGAIEGPS